MSVHDYWRILRRRWSVVAAVVTIGVLAALFIDVGSLVGQTRYEATHTLLRRESSDQVAVPGERRSESSLVALRSLVTSNAVAKRVADSIGFEGDPAQLAKKVTAVVDTAAQTLAITVNESTARQAESVADGFAQELVGHLDDTVTASRKTELDAGNARITELRAKLAAIEAKAVTPAQIRASAPERNSLSRQLSTALERVDLLQNAPLPSAGFDSVQRAEAKKLSSAVPIASSRTGRVGLALGLGLLLGAIAAVAIDRMDTRVRTKEQAELAFGVPVIGEIPPLPAKDRKKAQVITAANPDSRVAEAFRSLKSSLLLMRPDGAEGTAGALVILITSPGPGEGKTTTAANVAASFGESGKRVLLIDADLRSPRAHTLFGLNNGEGLSDVLSAGGPTRLRDVAVGTHLPNVGVVTAGTRRTNAAELLGHSGAGFLAEARTLADVVIVDTPPVLEINDANELAPYVDAVAVACRVGATSETAATRTADLLHRLAAPLRGVVLVGATEHRAKGYYYGYGNAEADTAGGRGDTPSRNRSRPAPPPWLSGTAAPPPAADTQPEPSPQRPTS